MKILVETSARHGHVTDEDLVILFGEGAVLTKRADLSQPGQFASEQRVDLVGPKSTIKNVIILGPTRKATQVEVSMTDLRALGLSAPIRESGDLEGSAPCKLVGPVGEIELEQGLIVAKRHLHTTPEDAEKLGVKDQDIINVRVLSKDRAGIFGDVVVRVSPSYATAMHIDTDESNSFNAFGEMYGEILSDL